MDPYGYYRVALNALVEHFFSSIPSVRDGQFVKVEASYMAGAELASIAMSQTGAASANIVLQVGPHQLTIVHGVLLCGKVTDLRVGTQGHREAGILSVPLMPEDIIRHLMLGLTALSTQLGREAFPYGAGYAPHFAGRGGPSMGGYGRGPLGSSEQRIWSLTELEKHFTPKLQSIAKTMRTKDVLGDLVVAEVFGTGSLVARWSQEPGNEYNRCLVVELNRYDQLVMQWFVSEETNQATLSEQCGQVNRRHGPYEMIQWGVDSLDALVNGWLEKVGALPEPALTGKETLQELLSLIQNRLPRDLHKTVIYEFATEDGPVVKLELRAYPDRAGTTTFDYFWMDDTGSYKLYSASFWGDGRQVPEHCQWNMSDERRTALMAVTTTMWTKLHEPETPEELSDLCKQIFPLLPTDRNLAHQSTVATENEGDVIVTLNATRDEGMPWVTFKFIWSAENRPCTVIMYRFTGPNEWSIVADPDVAMATPEQTVVFCSLAKGAINLLSQ